MSAPAPRPRRALLVLASAVALSALAYLFAFPTAPSARPAARVDTPPVLPRGPRPARSDPRPDILLFTIDSVRADHVWSYDGSRHTTPTLTQLASRGTQFDRAYSASSWTAPGIVSLLSGVVPSQHGVVHGLLVDDERVAGQETISDGLPLLATLLHDAGYRTVGVTAGAHLAAELGFARGFDSYRSFGESTPCEDVLDEVDRHLAALRGGDTPYFLWVHVVDPHAPFQPREPYFGTWWPAGEPRYDEIDNLSFEEMLPFVFRRDSIPPETGLAYVVAAYDSEIRAADAALERLLLEIDHEGLAIVVTSDQGEELMDHGRFGQGHTAFEEVVRVPLVLVLPDGSPESARRVETAVSTVDVMPTLLELASVAAPDGIAGRSLALAARGEELTARDLVIETGRGSEVVRAIVSDHIKYGELIAPFELHGMFDLDADPHELSNLFFEQPERAEALRERLTRIVDAAAARRPPTHIVPIELTDEERIRLRRLGYGN